MDESAEEAAGKQIALRVKGRRAGVATDRTLLYRILRNLVGNAVRYTEQGGVLVTCRPRGRHVLVQVWDTGVGIPADEQHVVFDEYHQLDNGHRDRDQGMGLGLSIVRRLCMLLDLPLKLRSEVQRGSVFSVWIPAGDAEAAGGDRVAWSPAWSIAGRCVVVIDDEQEIRDAMGKLIERWGCHVVVADGLHDAMMQLERLDKAPDVVLADLRLRDGRCGIAAINRLRARYGEAVAGVLITGDTAPARLAEVSGTGYELLQKPAQPIRLRRAIQRHLAARAAPEH